MIDRLRWCKEFYGYVDAVQKSVPDGCHDTRLHSLRKWFDVQTYAPLAS